MSIESGQILHPEIFAGTPIVGEQYQSLLTERVADIYDATRQVSDPDISVLVRTRNHADRLEPLFEDLHKQDFNGNVEVVVVDTESNDGTQDVARSNGATVIPITQHDFNYAHSLNVGFEAAENPYVLTLVGHSRLTNDQTLRSISRWAIDPDFAGAYGAALPDRHATIGDVAISLLQHNGDRLQPAEKLDGWQSGAMVAHRSAVSKAAWKELGGYDVAYGNGGEDTDMARRMLHAGLTVVREPGLSVHHSYELNPVDTVRHIMKLRKLRTAQPSEFEATSVRHLKK